MNPFSIMFIALGNTSEVDVRQIFSEKNLGTIDRIDTATTPDGRRKFFIHYSDFTAEDIKSRLVDFEKRKLEGEVDVRPPRIVYGEKRDGSPVYWQIYKTLTPSELASRSFKTTVTPRITGGKRRTQRRKSIRRSKRRR
jgi:hypothetical protein